MITISFTFDTLYQHFIKLSPNLFPNIKAWSFILVTLFYNALSVELQEVIRFNRYTLPNNSIFPPFLLKRLICMS